MNRDGVDSFVKIKCRKEWAPIFVLVIYFIFLLNLCSCI
jgi:F0F1-type ATP synthase membrane subunit a